MGGVANDARMGESLYWYLVLCTETAAGCGLWNGSGIGWV